MANIVKQPEIQQKLWTEIEQVVGKDSDEVLISLDFIASFVLIVT
jgi:hypothetical protein